jgi:Ca-activated chloride channel family protein
MMKAIKASLAPSDVTDHLRIVCFMTDGLVSNEDEIVAEVRRHPRARVFSFGIGSSVNRSLLDRIAQEGKATFRSIWRWRSRKAVRGSPH